MFYVSLKTHTARSENGFELPYHCDTCELETKARVMAGGVGKTTTAYGSGEGDAAATAARNAESNARYNALTLLRGTACPRCGRFSSAVRAALREASAKQRRLNKARIRLAPVSAGVGLLVGLALFAALGWRPILLLGTAGLTALGWAVVVLFTVRRVPVPPLAETQRIWFWLVPPDSDPPAWVVASHANAHWPDESVKGPSYYWSWLGSAAALCGAALCLVSAVTWYATTSTLYVVNTHEEEVVLFVDGKRRGTISTHIRADDDVPVEHFRLPEGLHHIQIATVGGAAIGSVDVDLESDTIYAPGARRLGLCFLDEVVWYAQSNPRPSEVCALETSDDLLKTGSVYDFYLSSPPQTVQTNHGLSTSRRGLRAVLCDTDGVEHPPIQPCR